MLRRIPKNINFMSFMTVFNISAGAILFREAASRRRMSSKIQNRVFTTMKTILSKNIFIYFAFKLCRHPADSSEKLGMFLNFHEFLEFAFFEKHGPPDQRTEGRTKAPKELQSQGQ